MAGEDIKLFFKTKWENGIFYSHTEVGERRYKMVEKNMLLGRFFPRGHASFFWARQAEGRHLCLGFNCVPD